MGRGWKVGGLYLLKLLSLTGKMSTTPTINERIWIIFGTLSPTNESNQGRSLVTLVKQIHSENKISPTLDVNTPYSLISPRFQASVHEIALPFPAYPLKG
jgi:hypothetical protein